MRTRPSSRPLPRPLTRLLPPLLCTLAAACGSSPTGSDATPPSTSPVSGFVFYDENGNGAADPAELVRLPGVSVSIGSATGSTSAGGGFSLPAVANGTQSVRVNASTLPAYFAQAAPQTITVPGGGEVAVAVAPPLGSGARPNVYMAIGDSITVGDGSSAGLDYPSGLQSSLRAYWGKADVVNEGVSGRKSNKGEALIGPALQKDHPAYALILFGTNDYNDWSCRNEFPCFTIDALRSMVQQARDAGALPVVGTIPPVNPLWVDRDAEGRNDWVSRMNVLVRQMAVQERAQVAEVYGDFMRQPSLAALFSDDKHPNDTGYRVLAGSFFNAITKPLGATTSGRGRSFSFSFGPSRGL